MMELDDKIIQEAMDRFGVSREEAEKQVQELIDMGLLQKNDDPSVPLKFKLTTNGSKFAEKSIIEKYGEFKKVTDHRGISYKVPTVVIVREGLKEDELNQFPLWSESDG